MRPRGIAAAVAAREAGVIYQARWYWLEALRLLAPAHRVAQVDFESSDDPHFDDVVTRYREKHRHRGLEVEADYTQLKFHVGSDRMLTWDELMDPRFMGKGSRTSLLQRLCTAVSTRSLGRFALITPWQISVTDPLAGMHLRGYGGALRVDKLVAASSGALQELSTRISDHTKTEVAALHALLSRLVIHDGKSLDSLTQMLDDRLYVYGLPEIGPEPGSKYDAFLVGRLQDEKITWNVDTLKKELKEHFDWSGPRDGQGSSYRIGIKQFDRFAEYIEDSVEAMCDLRPYFEDRNIREDGFWQTAVLPSLQAFVSDYVEKRSGDITLHVAAVTSIAYAFGALIHPRAPVNFLFALSGHRHREVWPLVNAGEVKGDPLGSETVDVGDGSDLAVAVSITHDVRDDVLRFVRSNPRIGRVLMLTSEPVGQGSVKDGAHARAIGDSSAVHIEKNMQPDGTAHLFISAPNSVSFSIGRASFRIPRATLYEFPFETPGDRTYVASITLDHRSR